MPKFGVFFLPFWLLKKVDKVSYILLLEIKQTVPPSFLEKKGCEILGASSRLENAWEKMIEQMRESYVQIFQNDLK